METLRRLYRSIGTPYSPFTNLYQVPWTLIIKFLIITGMAEKKILVCDICGDEAHSKRTIDVCTKHSVSGATRTRKPSTRVFKEMKCAICGKKVKEGAGYSAHMRRAHPDEVAKMKEQADAK